MYSSADNVELDMSALAASTAKGLSGSTAAGRGDQAALSERLWVVPPRSSKPVIVVVVSSASPARVKVRRCASSGTRLYGAAVGI